MNFIASKENIYLVAHLLLHTSKRVLYNFIYFNNSTFTDVTNKCPFDKLRPVVLKSLWTARSHPEVVLKSFCLFKLWTTFR